MGIKNKFVILKNLFLILENTNFCPFWLAMVLCYRAIHETSLTDQRGPVFARKFWFVIKKISACPSPLNTAFVTTQIFSIAQRSCSPNGREVPMGQLTRIF